MTKVATLGASFAAGAIFALGLVVSGMTHPSKVQAFLDIGGAWDPSLLFVMAGAIAVNAPLTWWIRKRSAPLLQPRFSMPGTLGPWWSQLDARLVVGSAVFGVGWGLAGYCPGPAIVSLPSALLPNESHSAAVFMGAMIAGMTAFSVYDRHRQRRQVESAPSCGGGLALGVPPKT